MNLGRRQPATQDADADELRQGRVAAARRIAKWTELDGEPIGRGPFLIDEPTDRIFTTYRGAIFEKGSPRILFNEGVPLHFFVDRDGDIRFLELSTVAPTWTAFVERRETRRHLRVAR